MGRYLAGFLYGEGHDLTMVDIDGRALDRLEGSYDLQTIEGHGASPRILRKAEIERADLFLAVTDNDEVNLLAATAAKHLGCKRCVARVQKSLYLEATQLFYKQTLEIDLVISPQVLTAHEVIKIVRTPGCEAVEDFAGGRVQMKQLLVPEGSPLAGRPLMELELPKGTLVVAILRGAETIIPRGLNFVKSGDEVLVLGGRNGMKRVEEAFGLSERGPRKIVIVGGGEIGLATAKRLQALGLELKLIERDEARCHELAEMLPKTLILNGDGTDLSLLKEERIETVDFFIAVSGEDEINLMSGLLAKNLGVKKCVVLVNKPDYQGIYSRLGIDQVISPRLLTAENILQFILGDQVARLEIIGENRAEILEMKPSVDSPILHTPLKEVQLPKGTIIGAIIRDNEVIIPRGESILKPGDTMVVFTLPEVRIDLEKIILGRKRKAS